MDNSMNHKQAPTQAESPTGFSRRNLLRGSVALGLMGLVGGMLLVAWHDLGGRHAG